MTDRRDQVIRALANLFVTDVRRRIAERDQIRQRSDERARRFGPAVAEIAKKAGATLR
jgi:hypothetical protein